VVCGVLTSWNCISYEAVSGVTSANLNLMPFFNDAISRGQLEAAWWLLDVEYGFEIWKGGAGLAVDSFSVSASAGGTTIASGNTYTMTPQNATALRLDDAGAKTTTGNPIEVYTTNGTGAQNWSASTSGVVPAGYYNFATEGAYCLTASGTASGSAVVLDGSGSMRRHHGAGLGSSQVGLQLHLPSRQQHSQLPGCARRRDASGTVVQVYTCNGGNNEEWELALN